MSNLNNRKMKAIIEKPLDLTFTGNHVIACVEEFNWIIEAIIEASNEKELRESFSIMRLHYHIYGFGAHHMWVHDRGSDNRLLIVEF